MHFDKESKSDILFGGGVGGGGGGGHGGAVQPGKYIYMLKSIFGGGWECSGEH